MQNRENKSLKFLHNLIRSVFSTFRIAEIKQESLCCLCRGEVLHSNLHNGTNNVQLIKQLKQNLPFHLPIRRWYCILKNVKSIRELEVLKITNVNVGHLYKFSDLRDARVNNVMTGQNQ